MPALCLVTPGTSAYLKGERLVVEIPSDEEGGDFSIREVPLREIESVTITEHVALTMPALAECLRCDIPVPITWRGERLLGICLPPAPHSSARLIQYQRVQDPAFRLALAGAIVRAKIANQRRVLQRLASNRSGVDVGEPLNFLGQIANRCAAPASIDALRGNEGAAAGVYFEALARFFPEDCPSNGGRGAPRTTPPTPSSPSPTPSSARKSNARSLPPDWTRPWASCTRRRTGGPRSPSTCSNRSARLWPTASPSTFSAIKP